jgi:hypothetical protein
MVSETLKAAIWEYRRRGGRLQTLALEHDMAPSTLSASLSGVRRVTYDGRLVRIGVKLGLRPEDCFDNSERAEAS